LIRREELDTVNLKEAVLTAKIMRGSGGSGGGGGSVTVDEALSALSENPVQNKAIAVALEKKADASALNGKVSVEQGKANAGKFLIVGSDGNVAPAAMTAWQGGSY
jgi:hypothetical protein